MDDEPNQLVVLQVQEATAGHILHLGQICNPRTVKNFNWMRKLVLYIIQEKFE